MLQQLNAMDDLCESTLVLKRKADILNLSYDIMAFQFISDTVIFLLTHVKYLIIINYQSLNYGVK